MIAPEFKTFMGFAEPEMAQEIAGILADAKILHNIYDSRKDFNPTFSNSEMGKEILIQILPQDFAKAKALVDEKMPLDVNAVDPDHFLFGFSDDELKDVVKRSDEWHVLDVKLAQHLLDQKGILISDHEMAAFREQDFREKSQLETINPLWLSVAYISAICVGPLGLLIGWYLATLKKKLPDGTQIYSHGQSDRTHGKIILFVGFTSAVVGLMYHFKS